MFININIIIFLAVMLTLALAAPLFTAFFRARKTIQNISTASSKVEEAQPVSIVIVEHDSAFRLEKVLPLYLSQRYGADYQVVVVIDQNDSESEDVLKRHGDNPHLYYTTLPVTSRYLSRKKLGITLGMRAAKYDWVIVTDVHCAPTSDEWLANFASHCTDDRNMVLGMTPYEDESPMYYRFEHLRTMLYHLRQAEKGMTFSTNQSLVALRKSEFFSQKGFGGNLEYTRSEFEFLANKFAKEDACTLALEPEAWLTQYNPNHERWRMRHLSAIHSFPAMQRRGTFRFLFHLDLWAMHIYNVLTLLALLAVIWMLFHELDIIPVNGQYVYTCIMLISALIIFWIISLVERCIIYAPVLRAFSNVHPLCAVFIEWIISWRNLTHRIRYWFADKNDFITHKL